MDYYVVTAVSEEGNVTCDHISDFKFNCNLSERNVNDFNYTVFSVTRGVDGILQNGPSVTDCCKVLILVADHNIFNKLFRFVFSSKFKGN